MVLSLWSSLDTLSQFLLVILFSKTYFLCSSDGPENVTITGGSKAVVDKSVTLDCSAPSLPPANYTWKFNDTVTNVTTNRYTIDKAEYSNTGTYTCEANNAETGKSSSGTILLSVRDCGESISKNVFLSLIIVLTAYSLTVISQP